MCGTSNMTLNQESDVTTCSLCVLLLLLLVHWLGGQTIMLMHANVVSLALEGTITPPPSRHFVNKPPVAVTSILQQLAETVAENCDLLENNTVASEKRPLRPCRVYFGAFAPQVMISSGAITLC